jgi:hypothetical protein
MMRHDLDPCVKLYLVARTAYFVRGWVELNKARKMNAKTTGLSVAVIAGLCINFESFFATMCWVVRTGNWDYPLNTWNLGSQACESFFRALRAAFGDDTGFDTLMAVQRAQHVHLKRRNASMLPAKPPPTNRRGMESVNKARD